MIIIIVMMMDDLQLAGVWRGGGAHSWNDSSTKSQSGRRPLRLSLRYTAQVEGDQKFPPCLVAREVAA